MMCWERQNTGLNELQWGTAPGARFESLEGRISLLIPTNKYFWTLAAHVSENKMFSVMKVHKASPQGSSGRDRTKRNIYSWEIRFECKSGREL